MKNGITVWWGRGLIIKKKYDIIYGQSLICFYFWNQKSHGAPSDEERHVGDLGNINIEIGTTIIDIEDSVASLYGDAETSVSSTGCVSCFVLYKNRPFQLID